MTSIYRPNGDIKLLHDASIEETEYHDKQQKLLETREVTVEEINTLPVEELMIRFLRTNMIVQANGRKITVYISKLTERQYDALVKRQSELMKDPSWMFFRVLMVASKVGGGFAGEKARPFLEGAYTATEGGEGFTKNMNQADRAPVDSQVSVKLYAKQKEETELQNVNSREQEAKRKGDDLIDKISQLIQAMVKN